MASAVASGLFNAVAFSAASFIFGKLSHKDYSQEMKRHNMAVEKLTKAKNEWYEKEVAKDHITKLFLLVCLVLFPEWELTSSHRLSRKVL